MKRDLRLNIIDEIAKSSGYDIALMTTFNYDISFFERAILSQLNAQNIRKVTVFVDSKELDKSISHLSYSNLGCRYMVNPINITGAFHPKVILLLGEDKAKLFVGSANITYSGMTVNNEVFNIINYTSDNPEYLDVINATIDFFMGVNSLSYQLDNELIEEVEQLAYYHRTNANGTVKLIHNLETPLLKQLSGLITAPIEEIKIAVPYYDSSLIALNDFATSFPEAKICLYLQNGKNTFPVKSYNKGTINLQTMVFEGFRDNQSNGNNNFYHGKAFLLKAKNTAYMIYGSSNCTQAALTKAVTDDGNIECDLMEVGKLNDFDYYFDAFDAKEQAEFKSHALIFESDGNSKYYYKYGEYTEESIILHIGYNNIKDPDIFIGGERLKPVISSDELLVTVSLELAENLPEIFDAVIRDAGEEIKIRCWTFSQEAVSTYRQDHSERYSLKSFEYGSEGDKYIQDRINIMNAEATCLPEIKERYKKMLS